MPSRRRAAARSRLEHLLDGGGEERHVLRLRALARDLRGARAGAEAHLREELVAVEGLARKVHLVQPVGRLAAGDEEETHGRQGVRQAEVLA